MPCRFTRERVRACLAHENANATRVAFGEMKSTGDGHPRARGMRRFDCVCVPARLIYTSIY